jgi:hypothetical protein
MPKAARLCQYDLPNGKLCRQVALKDEHVCRHHMRTYRHGMYDITHEEAMERLEADLRAMEIPRLLLALQRKLNPIQSVVRAYPEARLALNIALERLKARDKAARSLQRLTPETMPDVSSPEFQNFFENFTNAMR